MAQATQTAYIFSDHFNQAYLDDLYDGDLRAAEEVFASSIREISSEMALAAVLFDQGNVEEVRRIYHKIKPLFGYVGLLPVQEFVQQFENNCLRHAVTGDLLFTFNQVNEIILDALHLIREEQIKIRTYNNKRA
jgi:chemotaxis protein histidine kinase CheA